MIDNHLPTQQNLTFNFSPDYFIAKVEAYGKKYPSTGVNFGDRNGRATIHDIDVNEENDDDDEDYFSADESLGEEQDEFIGNEELYPGDDSVIQQQQDGPIQHQPSQEDHDSPGEMESNLSHRGS